GLACDLPAVWTSGLGLREMPFGSQRHELRDDPLDANSLGLRSFEDWVRARRQACRCELSHLPCGATYRRACTCAANQQRSEPYVARFVVCVRYLPPGQAPRTLRNGLRALPLDD